METFKIKLMLLGLMLMAGNLYGQPFKIGDTLPEQFFDKVYPAMDLTTGEETTLTLNDYRDKLVILYYWFNGCGPCIRSLNKCDSIQPLLKGKNYVVIPFTYQSLETTRQILQRFQWSMTTIIADSIPYDTFDGNTFRNTAWIKDGKVYATPESKYLTAENIIKVLENQPNPFPLQVNKMQVATR